MASLLNACCLANIYKLQKYWALFFISMCIMRKLKQQIEINLEMLLRYFQWFHYSNINMNFSQNLMNKIDFHTISNVLLSQNNFETFTGILFHCLVFINWRNVVYLIFGICALLTFENCIWGYMKRQVTEERPFKFLFWYFFIFYYFYLFYI